MNLPLKIRMKILDSQEKQLFGKVKFHDNNFDLKIIENSENIIKVPFRVMGVTGDKILVRVSGASGVYAEDHVIFQGKSEIVELSSSIIFSEIKNFENKFDTIEIFLK